MTVTRSRGRFGVDPDCLLDELRAHHQASAEHSLRVHQLVVAVTDGAGEPWADLARCAALLHDLGKLDVPVAILDACGQLTVSASAVIGGHSAAGQRRLLAAGADPELARTVRWIHERQDGSGYPDGLPGAQIPEACALVAVCDAFDAMTASDRHYCQPVSVVDALTTLHTDRGYRSALVRRLRAVLTGV